MDFENPFPCSIAREVGRSEFSSAPKAIAAMDTEWNQLETTRRPDPNDKGVGCWDVNKVRESASVCDQARRKGTRIQFVSALFNSAWKGERIAGSVTYTHLRAHETVLDLVCRLRLEKKKCYAAKHTKHILSNIKLITLSYMKNMSHTSNM